MEGRDFFKTTGLTKEPDQTVRVKLNLHTENFFLGTSQTPNQSLPSITSRPHLPDLLDPPYPAIACRKQTKDMDGDPQTKE